MQFHAIVWIDRHQAHVFRFNPNSTKGLVVLSTHRHPRLHGIASDTHAIRAMEDSFYFENVECALNGAGEILITGPENTKFELLEHMRWCAKPLVRRVIGVEIADHPTDPQLLQIASKYFGAANERFEPCAYAA